MNKKVETLAIRFTVEDMESIDKISKKEGMWASSWVRQVVIERLIKLGHKKKGKNHIMEYGR